MTQAITSANGVRTNVYADGDKTHLVHESVDHQDFLDHMATNRALDRDHGPADRSFRKIASVPASVILEWLTKHGVDFYNEDHWPAVMKLLRSPCLLYTSPSPRD